MCIRDSTQSVEFAENLLDLSSETDGTNIYTAILAEGKDGLTIEALPDGDLTDDLVKSGLTIYSLSLIHICLKGGTVAEGDEIPFTKMKVAPVAYGDIDINKYAKSVTIESVAKYGADVAVEKTDEAFLVALQNKVLTDFYTFLGTGTLKVTEKRCV